MYKKSRKRYILPIRGETPCEQIFTKFGASKDMPKVIICAMPPSVARHPTQLRQSTVMYVNYIYNCRIKALIDVLAY